MSARNKSACGTLYSALSSRQGIFILLVTTKITYLFNSLSCTYILQFKLKKLLRLLHLYKCIHLVECKNLDLDLDILNLVHIGCIGYQTIQFCKYILLAKTKISTEIQKIYTKILSWNYYLQASVMVSNGPQWSPKVLKGSQRSTKVLKGHTKVSNVLKCPQRCSKVLKGTQRSTEVLNVSQWS